MKNVLTMGFVTLKLHWQIAALQIVNLRPLAHCYKETGNHEKAKASLERAEALSDKASAQAPTVSRNESGDLIIEDEAQGRAEGLCQSGRLLAAEGKLDDAKVKFLEAMAEDPELALPHWSLALLEQMGFRDLEKAISHWEAARERMSDVGSVSRLGFLTRKLALAHYRLEEAVDVLSAFVSEHGGNVGQDEATKRLYKRMIGNDRTTKSVRLAHIQARHSREDEYCLPQSLATILEYWKLPNDVLKIGSFIGDDPYLGQALRYLDARAEEVSYKCFGPTVACIKALIDAGYPVLLVGQFLPHGRDNYIGHATVMAGYDEMLEQVLIEDANWFQGWEMLPYKSLHELRAAVIAPPEKLAQLTIELPDQEYHTQLIRLEPLVANVDTFGRPDNLAIRTLALPERENQEEVNLLESTAVEKGTAVAPEELEEMISLQPNYWYGHFLAGMVARREKDRYTAVRHLTRAAETSSRIAYAHLFIADCYADDKVTLEARDWLRRGLERESLIYILPESF
ncbi:MAG: hypothetical protein GWQ08_06885 [Verrucomicrobiaceae bacterium]|nr:hypothetical protein [Verrucomicrobiaceae bacterium]